MRKIQMRANKFMISMDIILSFQLKESNKKNPYSITEDG
jgi:hypothetical protein